MLKEAEKKNKRIKAIEDRGEHVRDEVLLYHRDLYENSDSEGEDSDDEDGAIAEQRRLRRKFRDRKPKTLKVYSCAVA
jgi:hypothetical protein